MRAKKPQTVATQTTSHNIAHKTIVQPLHTSIKGRARFSVKGLFHANHKKGQLENTLKSVPGIHKVEANPLTGNLLVLYAANIPIEDIVSIIEHHASSITVNTQALNSVTNVTHLHELRQKRRDMMVQPLKNGSLVPQNRAWHTLVWSQVLTEFASSDSDGLSRLIAEERLSMYGPNELPQAARRSDLSIFASQFKSLPVGLLSASAVISIFTGGALDAAVIMGVVTINSIIGFVTERQAENTINALTDVAPQSALVLREGSAQEIPVSKIVVGDILLLFPGCHIAADARLIKTQHLSLDESALTGESMPVIKFSDFLGDEDTPLGDRKNMVYMGTLVTGGNGIAVVVATGLATELGKIQALVGETRPPETPMQRQLNKMGTQLALLSGAVCAGVFTVGLLRGYTFLQMLKASIALAVAAVPEGLPTVATTTLALGIQRMRKHNVAVRHLDAVETLGAVQVFCLDKTGTLTLNRMTVVRIYSATNSVTVHGGHFFQNDLSLDPNERDELLHLLHVISLCNESEIKDDNGTLQFSGSSTENALLEVTMNAGIDVVKLRAKYPRLSTQFRSEGRPYMKTTHRLPNGKRLLAVKGSPAEVLAMCRTYIKEAVVTEMDEATRSALQAENERMAGDALRVLGVAYTELEDDQDTHGAELMWLGLVGLTDPIRTGMNELMQLFHTAGIHTIMITGDQSATAYAIGKQLNLNDQQALEILDSTSLEKLDPELLAGFVKKVHVFARVSPANKLQIVQALQKAGNVVAMTGDGINDGPALKAADIGVAMGAAGTEVARSVADVVLEDDNLHTMVVAIRQGRTIYSNIRKALHFLLATNFTEIEVMLAGIALGLGQPLNPMQLLWINLISDIFPGLALSLEPPEPDVLERPPRNPDEPIVRVQDLKRMGFESAVITAGAMGSYGYALARYGQGIQAGTVAFTTLTFGQLLHAISCRSDKHSLFSKDKLPPNRYLTVALTGSFAAQALAMTVPGLRSLLGTSPIGLVDGLAIAAGAGLPLLINEATKTIGKDISIHKEIKPIIEAKAEAAP